MKADNYRTDVKWFDVLDATRVSESEGVPFWQGESYNEPYIHCITMNESREPRLAADWYTYKRCSSCRHAERSAWRLMRISRYDNVR
jgi:hypothetical protein